jgi:hypothetical protein
MRTALSSGLYTGSLLASLLHPEDGIFRLSLHYMVVKPRMPYFSQLQKTEPQIQNYM